MIGAYGGTVVLTMWSLTGPGNLPIQEQEQELQFVLAWILVVGSFALPFVAIGLVLFGLPVAPALRRVPSPWMGVVILLWGAVAGKLLFAAVEAYMITGTFDPLILRSPDVGLSYGMSAAPAWWWLERYRARTSAPRPPATDSAS